MTTAIRLLRENGLGLDVIGELQMSDDRLATVESWAYDLTATLYDRAEIEPALEALGRQAHLFGFLLAVARELDEERAQAPASAA